ncbi:hypothetical protein KUG47_06965 [Falsochrobactrum sp. TDYN1]|uniref:Uncharacterized protein n=1 Tax=Falsochrobactrum tianjinense TaxID=2706015 RepID=A0A949UT00_9HYPH|nr:hypothetical protein [Falsochrobactrum sp. TDYN1]MBV2143235.1 hypothetical protein [Falsochrobactrum sp. TDYN1]
MSVRFQIAVILSVVVNAVLFGMGAITVLSIPALSEHAKFWLPAVIIFSFLITPIVSWFIAPRMRNRYWQKRKAAAH